MDSSLGVRRKKKKGPIRIPFGTEDVLPEIMEDMRTNSSANPYNPKNLQNRKYGRNKAIDPPQEIYDKLVDSANMIFTADTPKEHRENMRNRFKKFAKELQFQYWSFVPMFFGTSTFMLSDNGGLFCIPWSFQIEELRKFVFDNLDSYKLQKTQLESHLQVAVDKSFELRDYLLCREVNSAVLLPYPEFIKTLDRLLEMKNDLKEYNLAYLEIMVHHSDIKTNPDNTDYSEYESVDNNKNKNNNNNNNNNDEREEFFDSTLFDEENQAKHKKRELKEEELEALLKSDDEKEKEMKRLWDLQLKEKIANSKRKKMIHFDQNTGRLWVPYNYDRKEFIRFVKKNSNLFETYRVRIRLLPNIITRLSKEKLRFKRIEMSPTVKNRIYLQVEGFSNLLQNAEVFKGMDMSELTLLIGTDYGYHYKKNVLEIPANFQLETFLDYLTKFCIENANLLHISPEDVLKNDKISKVQGIEDGKDENELKENQEEIK